MNNNFKIIEKELLEKIEIIAYDSRIHPCKWRTIEDFYDALESKYQRFNNNAFDGIMLSQSSKFEVCSHLIYLYNFENEFHSQGYELYYDDIIFEIMEGFNFAYSEAFRDQGIAINQSFPLYSFNENLEYNLLNACLYNFQKELKQKVYRYTLEYHFEPFFQRTGLPKVENFHDFRVLEESLTYLLTKRSWCNSFIKTSSPYIIKCTANIYIGRINDFVELNSVEGDNIQINKIIIDLIQMFKSVQNNYKIDKDYENNFINRRNVTINITEEIIPEFLKSDNLFEKMYVHSPMYINNELDIEITKKTDLIRISDDLKKYYLQTIITEGLKTLQAAENKISMGGLSKLNEKLKDLDIDHPKYDDILKNKGVNAIESIIRQYKKEMKIHSLRDYSIIYFLFKKEKFNLFRGEPTQKDFIQYLITYNDSSLNFTALTPLDKISKDRINEINDYLDEILH